MSKLRAHMDFESAGVVDLRQVGVYRYAEDRDTQIWMLSWRLGDGPVQRWHPGDPEPQPLLAHVAAGGTFVAHNANFERQMWNGKLRSWPQYAHWPKLEIAQMDCTMARALAVHLPADLDSLGIVLGLPVTKDREGHALMMKMSRPRKMHPDGRIEWWNTPENIEREGRYCDQDVVVESLADEKLPPLSAEELRLWRLDQIINDRGILIDSYTVERCVEVLEIAQSRANARMAILTDGFVKKCSEALKIVEWLQGRGIPAESIAKGEHDELKTWADCLGDPLAREVVELRAEAGRNSTAKFQKMLDCRCADGRLRGMLNFHRALTGRWGGALCQPHNLPRCDPDTELPDVLAAIEIMGNMLCRT